jgi:hypothetical protein
LYDYPETDSHPAFNLALRVNFVDGGGEKSGFQFTGSEGVMTVAGGVTLSRRPRETEPGYTVDTFPNAIQEKVIQEYRAKYPPQPASADAMRPDADEHFLPPEGYSDHFDHIQRFFASVRSRQPVVEDAAFGFRAAAPALLSNVSYFENRIATWDPENMTIPG